MSGKPFPNGARIAVIIRDDDTCALTPPHMLETVYAEAWKRHFPVSLSTVAAMIGSHNPNIPPAERGSGKAYNLTEASPVTSLLKKQQKEGLVEIVQHGLHHTTNLDLRYPAFGEKAGYTRELLTQSSEFFGMSKTEVVENIQKGKKALEALFGPVQSFVAPQEYLTPDMWQALQKAGMSAYSGGIRPQFWEYVPFSAVNWSALMRLVRGVLQRKDPAFLGETVARLTPALPLIPATYRHYWSGHETAEHSAMTLDQAKRIFTQKYDKGGGYFLILTHYWEYFGDWQKEVTQKHQLLALNELLSFIETHELVWKCTLGEYGAWLREHLTA